MAQIFVAVLGASSFTFAKATWTQALSQKGNQHEHRLEKFKMNAKELADKFNAKTGAAVVERARQSGLAAEHIQKRSEDIEHCKRAMESNVLPFLAELKQHLGEGQFTFAPQIDIQDHKPVGVSFKIGDGGTTSISTALGNIMVTPGKRNFAGRDWGRIQAQSAENGRNSVRRPGPGSLTYRNYEGFCRPGSRVGLPGLDGGAEGIQTDGHRGFPHSNLGISVADCMVMRGANYDLPCAGSLRFHSL
jgi:hypothetical protein